MSTRPRDSQRSKVYRAERAAGLVGHETAPELATVPLIEDYVETLMGRAWFKRRWPMAANREVEVRPGRGARRAFASGSRSITIPRWARHEGVILHEMAHIIVQREYQRSEAAAHGWQFCHVYLELVRYAIGREAADELKAQFRNCKVRYTKPRAKRVLSEEEKQVLRDRLGRARAAKEAANA